MGRAGSVTERELDSAHLIELSGDVDVANAAPFVHTLLRAVEQPRARVVLDLTDADFIDSTVLNALYTAIPRLRESRGRLAIVCTKDHLYRVLEGSGINGSYPVVSSRDAALEALA
jgi:anti-anti-sigma factor